MVSLVTAAAGLITKSSRETINHSNQLQGRIQVFFLYWRVTPFIVFFHYILNDNHLS